MKESLFSWLVTLKDGSRKTGALQVNADEFEIRDGVLIFYRHVETGPWEKIISLTIAYGCWKSACLMSQISGYRTGIEVLDVKKDEGTPL